MPNSLKRTWVSLAVAIVAVLFVAFLAGRDFVRDVFPTCSTSLVEIDELTADQLGRLNQAALDQSEPVRPSALVSLGSLTPQTMPALKLRFDTKVSARAAYGAVSEYSNVRIDWSAPDADGKSCACGSFPVLLSGESPWDVRLFRVKGEDTYLVMGRPSQNDGRPEMRGQFKVVQRTARHFQSDRVFTSRHLSGLVVLLALGALGVALLRSRRAMAYALRLHTWTEGRLTPEGMIEGDSGGTLGTLENGQLGNLAIGPVLVAPDSISTAGLYRDMPIVARRNVVEGDHARWASGTMQRLRDARVLAMLSALCTTFAFAARLIA